MAGPDDDELEHHDQTGGAQVPAGLVVAGVLAAALASFIVQNTDQVTVSWLVFEVEAPLWIVLLVTAAVALVITELLGFVRRRRKR